MMYSYTIEKALRAAAVLHSDQTRKGKAAYPFVTHPYAVALMVADYVDDEPVIIAALLHDTLRDTAYTAVDLADDFGSDVARLVLAISEPVTDTTHVAHRDEQKKRYMSQLEDAEEGALIICAADKIHEMRTRIEEYLHHANHLLREFGGALDEQIWLYQSISNVLNRRLKSDILHEFNHVFDEYKKFITHAEKTAAV